MAHGLAVGVIDAHCHLWDLAVTPQEWIVGESMAAIDRDFAVDDLDEVLATHAVGSAVLVQANNSLAETRFLLDAVVSSSSGHRVVGWVDLTADVEAQLNDIGEHPAAASLCGVRHLAHVDPDPGWLARDDVASGIRVVAAHGLTCDLVVRAHQLPAATALAGRVPEATFVLDHAGNPPSDAAGRAVWEADLRRLAALPNTVCKLSGLATNTTAEAALAVALDAFGANRAMFGSDWPLVRLSDEGYGGWVDSVRAATARLTVAERERVFAGTAQAVYAASFAARAAR